MSTKRKSQDPVEALLKRVAGRAHPLKRVKVVIDCACPPEKPGILQLHFVGFIPGKKISCAASDDRSHILKIIACLGMHQWLDDQVAAKGEKSVPVEPRPTVDGVATEQEVLDFLREHRSRRKNVFDALHDFARCCEESWPPALKQLWKHACDGSVHRLRELILLDGAATSTLGRLWQLGIPAELRPSTASLKSDALEPVVRSLLSRLPDDRKHHIQVHESRRNRDAQDRTKPARKSDLSKFVSEVVKQVAPKLAEMSEQIASLKEQVVDQQELLRQAIENAHKIKEPQGKAELSSFREIGDPNTLLAYLLEHRNACSPTQVDQRMKLNRNIVEIALLLGLLRIAEGALGELLHEDPNDIRALTRKGDVFRHQARFKEAEACYTRTLEIGDAIHDSVAYASALANIGLIALDTGRLNDAIDRFLEALPIELRNRRPTAVGKLRNNLGLAYKQRGDLELAAREYELAIEVCSDSNDAESLANAFGNLGSIRTRQRRLKEAAQLQEKAYDANKALGRKIGMARARGNLAFVFKAEHDLPRSEEMQREALGLFQEIGDQSGAATAHLAIAKLVLTRGGDHAVVEEHLRQSLLYYDSTASHQGKAETHTVLASLRERQSNLRAAIAHLWKAADVYHELGNCRKECMRLGKLMDWARLIGDTEGLARAQERRAALNCPERPGEEEPAE